jgi:hypothetical protein
LDQVKASHTDARFRQRHWKQNGKAGKGEGKKKKKKKALAVAISTRGRPRLSPGSIWFSRRRFAFETPEI